MGKNRLKLQVEMLKAIKNDQFLSFLKNLEKKPLE